jgi:hypothetical protein
LKREEAVHLLKTILTSCSSLNPQIFSLDESSVNDPFNGYRIVINGKIDAKDRELIELAAETHELEIKQENNKMSIYKPRKSKPASADRK